MVVWRRRVFGEEAMVSSALRLLLPPTPNPPPAAANPSQIFRRPSVTPYQSCFLISHRLSYQRAVYPRSTVVPLIPIGFGSRFLNPVTAPVVVSSFLWKAGASPFSFTSPCRSPRSVGNSRKGRLLSKLRSKNETKLHAPVVLEESLDSNSELECLLQQLEHDGPLAMKFALDGLDDIPQSETVELSVVICNDDYICLLNKEWRGEDCPTDVLSFPQDQPPGMLSTWLLGDVIISVDTAKQQAEERGHSLLDEMRILLVHGLLHILGYDHEESLKEAAEMEKEELRVLKNLGWNTKGLITASSNEVRGGVHLFPTQKDGEVQVLKPKTVWKDRSPFRVLICDLDGTLLNSKSQITKETAAALKAVIARGVKVIIATGKTRPAAMTACQTVGLDSKNGIASGSLPGIFLQGLLVYGENGKTVHSQTLNPRLCKKAFKYSLENRQPLLGFSGDRTVTLFNHPRIEELHSVYMEPKAEILPSLEYLVKNFQVQKLLFPDTAERIEKLIRPYWHQETKTLGRVVQAQADMLEIIPVGASKGKGVTLLLNDLGIHADDVMAIGDGENDIEMLELVGWGVAMGNSTAKTLAVADAQVASNDEDGVVEAVERFILA